jgi:hypothetical protein
MGLVGDNRKGTIGLFMPPSTRLLTLVVLGSSDLIATYAIGGGGGLSDVNVALSTIPSAFKPTLD